MENTIGIDLGLKAFLVDDSGKDEPIPQYYRKAQKRLRKVHKAVSRQKKGSSRRRKAINRLAKVHQKVANQRKDFHYKVAKKLLSQGKHVAHEELNILGLARTRMAKSLHDAGWGQFLEILSIKAERAGLMTIAVNPNGTTQDCSGCGVKVPKTLKERIHQCSCGLTLCRDHNAARNIKYRAVGHSVLKARGVYRNSRTKKREARDLTVLR